MSKKQQLEQLLNRAKFATTLKSPLKARKLYNLCLADDEINNDQKALAYNNLAMLFMKNPLKDLTKSEFYLLKTLELKESVSNDRLSYAPKKDYCKR
ncbi:MAG TPA: hypothetical protein QF353_00270 [Gammaproteobacteria bacterium]|nr:hypothetical protein [Gammaproteobacteria bacterium]